MKAHMNKMAVWLSVPLAMAAGNSLHADVVGWWRFEDNPGFAADSSGRGYSLTSEGEAGPVQVAAEEGFDNPLPQTGDANLKAADFNGTNNFYVTDKTVFDFGRHLTVEAYFRVDSWPESMGVLAGQFASTLGQQSWFFGIRSTGELQFRASSIGNSFANYTSDFAASVVPGKDYYAAVVYDGAAARCTIYLKNLTDGGLLEQFVTNNINVTSLFNSTVHLNIGAIVDGSKDTGDTRLRFDGRIDEVRISDKSLLPEHLLVNEAVETGNIVGYWRFEDSPGFLKDSGPMGLTLSRTHANWPQAATPGLVAHVPLTRDDSWQHADFGTDQLGWFTTPAPTAGNYVSGDFTIEAFVRQTAINTNTVYIFCQWNASTSERSFSFFVGDGGTYAQGELCLSLSPNGVNSVVVQSDWENMLVPDKDYYVAVSFDESDQTSGVTFYYRNLTDNGPLLSKKVGHSISRLFDSIAPLKLGTLDVSKRCWPGRMDEVRLACAVLPEEQLLGTTPPPAGTLILVR